MFFDVDFILSVFVSQTLFAAICNLVDLIKTILNSLISRNFKLKSFFYKYAIFLSPFVTFLFFFIIGIVTSILLTTLRIKSRCEVESEKRRKRQEVLNELKETIEKESNISSEEKILVKYISLANAFLD